MYEAQLGREVFFGDPQQFVWLRVQVKTRRAGGSDADSQSCMFIVVLVFIIRYLVYCLLRFVVIVLLLFAYALIIIIIIIIIVIQIIIILMMLCIIIITIIIITIIIVFVRCLTPARKVRLPVPRRPESPRCRRRYPEVGVV